MMTPEEINKRFVEITLEMFRLSKDIRESLPPASGDESMKTMAMRDIADKLTLGEFDQVQRAIYHLLQNKDRWSQ